jgi:uncharacterized membrane protein YbhN (UPF0104 family)
MPLPPAILRNAPRLLRVAVALGLLGLLWHIADGAEAARRLARADPRWLVAAVAALTLQTVLSALRWRLTAGRLGILLGRQTAIREYYLAQIVNQALPGGVLGDAGRAIRARAQAGLLASGQAVVFERAAGQVALFLVFAAGFLATLAVPGGLDWPRALALPLAALVLAGLTLPILARTALPLFPVMLRTAAAAFGDAFARAVWAPDVRVAQAVLSLGTALANVAAFAFCIRAVGADLAATATLALVPLILVTMVVPITISGWGLREGAAAALFPIAGATASEGLAASVAFGLVFIASVLPGVILIAINPAPRGVKS